MPVITRSFTARQQAAERQKLVSSSGSRQRRRQHQSVQDLQRRTEDRSDSSGSQPSPIIPTSEILISEKTDLKYQTDNFSVSARQAAGAAFRFDTSLRLASSFHDDRDEVFVFDLVQDIRVSIANPALAHDRLLLCSCATKPAGGSCEHVWWVTDQIVSGSISNRGNLDRVIVDHTGQNVSLVTTSGTSRVRHVYEILERKHGDIERYMWHLATDEDARASRSRTFEIVTLFEPSFLFPHELMELGLDDQESAISGIFKKFTELLAGPMLTSHQQRRIQEYLTQEMEGRMILRKVQNRINNAFVGFILGTNAMAGFGDIYDVSQCAGRLHETSTAVKIFVEGRGVRHPAAAGLQTELALLMLSIIEKTLVLRVRPALGASRSSEFVDDPLGRDLYSHTIGRSRTGGRFFVLENLAILVPSTSDRRLQTYAEDILQMLHVADAPRSYVGRLNAIIEQWLG